MQKKIAAFATAFLSLFFCSFNVCAQEEQALLYLPSGGPYRLDRAQMEACVGKQFQSVAVTLTPDCAKAALFLNGKLLSPGQVLTRAEASRVVAFVSNQVPGVSLGLLAFPGEKQNARPRIRCINPTFTGIL